MAIDTVIKLGGSLSLNPELTRLCLQLKICAATHRLLVIPGGAGFADAVRRYYNELKLSETAAHKMAILAMDQYAYLLHDITPGSRLVQNTSEADEALDAGMLPIMLPADTLLQVHQEIIPHCWDVTSDSLAAYLTTLVGASRLILLKDVDGIFSHDPKTHPHATLLPEIKQEELSTYRCVDPFFGIALGKRIKAWVINGLYPERLAELLDTGKTKGTAIL